MSGDAVTERPPRRKTRAGPAGREILQATERLLQTHTFAALSVERICDEAATTRATFYHYYGSKHAALAALAGELWDDVFATITPYTQGPDSPQRTIRDTFRQAWQIWIDHAPVFRALAENWSGDPELTQLWTAIINRFTEAIALEIDRERATGAAPPGPDSRELAAVLLWSTAHCLHIAGLHASDHMPDEPALFETMMTVWLRSIYASSDA
jgi:AcrR family transcriptional regulator